MEIDVLDDLGRCLVHALQIDGRVPFGKLAAVLGVSDQTVARRYRRLRAAGLVRVVGLPASSALGYEEWFLRLRCLPESALPIAHAVARRDEVSWVMLGAAGTEITCLARTRTRDQRDALLLGALPRTRHIVEVDARSMLRTFVGGPTGWNVRTSALTGDQIALLVPERPAAVDPTELDPIGLEDADEAMLAALRLDGRTPVTALATALGCSPSAAGRRLDRLVGAGAVFFDVEIPPELLGRPVEALLWVSVAPAALEATAMTAAGHPQAALVAATSGSTNLVLAVGCRDVDDLYAYVANDLGRIPAVQAINTAPVIRTVKRAGTLLEHPGTARQPRGAQTPVAAVARA